MIDLLPWLIAMGVLILCSGFFSSSEAALFLLSPAEQRSMASGSRPQRTVTELLSDPDIVAALETRLGKKPSVDQLKGEVLNLDEYRDVKSHEIRAEVERSRIRGVLDAILAKRDGLISLGAHIRAEMRHDPTIRE